MCSESCAILLQDFEDVFNGTGCFDGTFSLQLKPDSKPYQVPLRHMVYTLQKSFRGGIRKATKTGHNSTSRGR